MQPGGDKRQGTISKVCEGKRGPGWGRGRQGVFAERPQGSKEFGKLFVIKGARKL